MARILVIDDDLAVQELIVLWLKKEGHEITTARDGKEGAQKFCAEMPDLVITDLFMPAKDGMEMLIDLRQYLPLVKFIVVSGWGDQYLRTAIALGAWRALAKPFRAEQLVKLVTEEA